MVDKVNPAPKSKGVPLMPRELRAYNNRVAEEKRRQKSADDAEAEKRGFGRIKITTGDGTTVRAMAKKDAIARLRLDGEQEAALHALSQDLEAMEKGLHSPSFEPRVDGGGGMRSDLRRLKSIERLAILMRVHPREFEIVVNQGAVGTSINKLKEESQIGEKREISQDIRLALNKIYTFYFRVNKHDPLWETVARLNRTVSNIKDLIDKIKAEERKL